MPARTTGGRSLLILAAFVVITEALPALVQAQNADGWSTWDAQLAKPWWQPPGWAFGVVWPALYLLMAIAAWVVWLRGGWAGAKGALSLYGVQLVVNALWTWVYLGVQTLPGSFFWICGLWILIVATLAAFLRHSRLAALLLVPYLGWVTFAAFLSYAIWRMNAV